MKESKGKQKIFYVNCPNCHSVLWVDPVTKEVIKSEKGKRKKDSLEELLSKEKKRIDEFDRKFEATAELEKKKWKKIQEKFEKSLNELDKEE